MPAQAWEKTLRKQIKDNHGFGWNVIAQSGKTKLTRVFEDGTKLNPELLGKYDNKASKENALK